MFSNLSGDLLQSVMSTTVVQLPTTFLFRVVCRTSSAGNADLSDNIVVTTTYSSDQIVSPQRFHYKVSLLKY